MEDIEDKTAIDPASLSLPLTKTSRAYKGPKEMTHIHHAMVDAILTHPTITTRELGEMFGYSTAWVNLSIQSPLFKNILDKRRAEIVNPIIIATTQERLQAVVDRSLDVIHEKLNKNPDQVSEALALKALELGSKALGMGQPKKEELVVDVSHLDNLAKRLVALKPRETTEGVIYEAEK